MLETDLGVRSQPYIAPPLSPCSETDGAAFLATTNVAAHETIVLGLHYTKPEPIGDTLIVS